MSEDMQGLLKMGTKFFNVINYIALPFSFFVLLFLPFMFTRSLHLRDIIETISLLLFPIIIILSLIYSRKYYKIGDYKNSFLIIIIFPVLFLLEFFIGSFF